MRSATTLLVVMLVSTSALSAGADPLELPLRVIELLRQPDGGIPDRIAGFARVGAFDQGYGIRLIFTLDDTDPTGPNLVELLLTRRDEAQPALARTASYNISYKGPTEGGRPAARVRPLLEELLPTIDRNDHGTDTLDLPPVARLAHGSGPTPIERTMAILGLALVVGFLLLLPLVGFRLVSDLRVVMGPWFLPLVVVVLAGLIVRLVLPHMPVMMYMGYRLVDMAHTLDGIPKYGPGVLALHHLMFKVTGPSHIPVMHLNAVLGGLLPLVSAGLIARLGAGRAATMAAGILVAGVPLFIKDSTTESLLLPTLFWTALGLYAMARMRVTGSRLELGAASLLLVLAAYSRPETVVLAPLAGILIFLVAPRANQPESAGSALPRVIDWRWIAGIAALAVVLLVLRVLHLKTSVGAELALGNTQVLTDVNAILALAPQFLTRNLLFKPDFYPTALILLMAVAMVTGPLRLRLTALALILPGIAWLALSLLDLPHVSMARVQVPGLWFLTMAAALGVGVFLPSGACLPRNRWSLLLALPVLAALSGTIPCSAARLWERTNADDEESLFRDALAALPAESVVFVRRDYGDLPAERLHLFNPDYLFRPPFRNDIVVGADRFRAMDRGERPAFFMLGTRCYLRECGTTGMHPACTRILREYRLEPVLQRTVPVRRVPLQRKVQHDQDLDMPWCISEPEEMRLGLFRVVGPAVRSGSMGNSDVPGIP